jgi:hypothetical protein
MIETIKLVLLLRVLIEVPIPGQKSQRSWICVLLSVIPLRSHRWFNGEHAHLEGAISCVQTRSNVTKDNKIGNSCSGYSVK